MEITDRRDLAISHDSNYAYIDRAKVHGPIMVRHPQPGDRFHPYGMKGSKLISDFLTDLKLNRIEKEEQLLVCDDRDILWVVGRRSSELHKMTGNTVDVIVLRAKN
jgi:tRNA(Ile)-lysidine synthase